MNNRILPRYKCTQTELYTVCRMIWLSFLSHLTTFTSRKAFYTAAFGNAMLAEIEAAKALPDYQARGDAAETLGLELLQASENCLFMWRLLKSYIITKYKDQAKPKIEAAGAGYYLKAGNQNWGSCNSLMAAGYAFILANQSDLESGSNMPTSFVTDFLNSKDNFTAVQDLFETAEENIPIQTQTKLIANNTVFDKTMEMGKDGQLFIPDDPALQQQFIFESALTLVKGNSGAGLRGIITNSLIVPQEGVTLSLYTGTNTAIDARYTTVTEDDGSYDFGITSSGSYTLKMEKEGFVTKLEVVEILLGVKSTKDFSIVEV